MQPYRTIELPDDLIDEIQFEIFEAPYDSIVHFLRRAVVEFCEKTHYWQEEIGPILVMDNVFEYELPDTATLGIVAVESVSFDDDGDECRVLERCNDHSVKYRYWQDTAFSISFYPHEHLVGRRVSVIAALKPKIDCDQFEFSSQLVSDYRDAIAAAAKSLLYKIPRKPWTDAGQFQINNQIYLSSVSEARLRQSRGFTNFPDRIVRKQRKYY